MRRILTLAAIAVLVVALAAASPASAKQLRCGAYAKSDGSLAKSVVTMNRLLPGRAYDAIIRRQYGLPA